MDHQENFQGSVSTPQLVERKVRLNPVLVALAALGLSFSGLTIVLVSRWNAILMLLLSFVGVLIILPLFHFIRTKLYTPEVEWTFLVNQFLLILLPIQWLFIATKFILFILFARLLFESDITRILPKLMSKYDELKSVQLLPSLSSALLHIVVHSLPSWKLALFCVCMAFVSFALIQTTFWLVARRVKSMYRGELNTVHGILSSTSACALGAACARYGAMLMMFPMLLDPYPSYKCNLAIDGFLSFPLYFGTLLFIAVQAGAQQIDEQMLLRSEHDDEFGATEWEDERMRNETKLKVARALLVSVLVHGVYTCISLLPTVLLELKQGVANAPGINVAIFVAKAFLVITFGMLVRGRFMALLERQHAIVAPSYPG